MQVELALQYNDGYQETLFAYANNIHTIDGGTHVSGFRTALTRVLNNYARKNNLLKEKDANFTGDDVREGLTVVLSVKLPNPQFESQTKVKLRNAEIDGIVNSIVGEAMTDFPGREPGGRAQNHRKGAHRIARARRRAQSGRVGAQIGAGVLQPARQTLRLPQQRSGGIRAVPGGGRFRGRLREEGAQQQISRRCCRCAAWC